MVAPRQSWQTPVSGWHDSACPLQAQGWQCGKPHRPERQRSQRRPARPARHVHCPLVGLQTALAAPSGWQRQSRHPVGPRPNVPGRQRSQVRPMMLGRQGHCPPSGAHSVLSEPCRWHSHARPPPWSRAEMLQERRAQASGMLWGGLTLAASRQPTSWSSCKRPGAPGSTDLSPGNSPTRGRSTTESRRIVPPSGLRPSLVRHSRRVTE